MTQTSTQPPDRVSSRQRRIEEQRRKIEQVRSQERRKRLTWGAGIVVLVAVAFLGWFLTLR